MKSLVFWLLTGIFCYTYGQSPNAFNTIAGAYDTLVFQDLLHSLRKDFRIQEQLTTQWAKAIGQPVNKNEIPQETPYRIAPDGTPLYLTPYAFESSLKKEAKTKIFDTLYAYTEGKEILVGIWDATAPLKNHQEYRDRVKLMDTLVEGNPRHATITTGTLIASGKNSKARGVLPYSKALAFDWYRDKIEAAEMAAKGLLLSNHSYGMKPDNLPDWYFGSYLNGSAQWDGIMHAAPFYQMVVAAGNSQKGKHNGTPLYGTTSFGWDVLLGPAVSKNSLTVSAADVIWNPNGFPKSATVTPYSSMGPTDDGRIKPDIAFHGNDVFTTTGPENDDYGSVSGTSVAAAKTTGFLGLLHDYFYQKNGHYMKAATLKGLALHTASDVGEKGPDYRLGWGILNPLEALTVLKTLDHNSLIEENRLADGETYVLEVEAMSAADLSVSLSWTDPPFEERLPSNVVNNPTPVLLHDLDIIVVQGTQTFRPWVLDPRQPNRAATTGNNTLDPFERINIANARGAYTILVTHKGTLNKGYQDFSLVVSGLKLNDCVLEAPQSFHISHSQATSLELSWENLGEEATYTLAYKTENATEWIHATTQVPNIRLSGLARGLSYAFKVQSQCSKTAVSSFGPVGTFNFVGEASYLNPTKDTANPFPTTLVIAPVQRTVQLNPLIPTNSTFSIFDITGQLISRGRFLGATIPFASQPAGIYIILLGKDGFLTSAKFSKVP